jgi:hypothetical protein
VKAKSRRNEPIKQNPPHSVDGKHQLDLRKGRAVNACGKNVPRRTRERNELRNHIYNNNVVYCGLSIIIVTGHIN